MSCAIAYIESENNWLPVTLSWELALEYINIYIYIYREREREITIWFEYAYTIWFKFKITIFYQTLFDKDWLGW